MRRCAPLVLIAALLFGGCAPRVDLTTGLQIKDVGTGWFDAGIINGQNKLVPSVVFTVKNVSDQKLVALQINAVFRRVTEKDEWGAGFLMVSGSEGLAPGAEAPRLTIRSQLGYTGSDQTREDMLKNSHFVDAEVELFAKYASEQWKRVAESVISRRLLTK